eukprot:1160024-Pelagomonas_calceolata.AAC.7
MLVLRPENGCFSELEHLVVNEVLGCTTNCPKCCAGVSGQDWGAIQFVCHLIKTSWGLRQEHLDSHRTEHVVSLAYAAVFCQETHASAKSTQCLWRMLFVGIGV